MCFVLKIRCEIERCLTIKAGLVLACFFLTSFSFAQQAGSIEGRILWSNDLPANEVRVTAVSEVMPRPRSTKSDAKGKYQLDRLIPGNYHVTFSSVEGTATVLTAVVLVGKKTVLNLVLTHPEEQDVEELVVVGLQTTLRSNASVANAIAGDTVQNLPIRGNYRDLLKFAPGVQYSEDSIRGPSAGGNGQDNIYRFDGVDVSLPMFGTLSAEPSSHDVEQVTFDRAGVSAVGFNRSGGFTMDSTSRSGTDKLEAELEYATRPDGLRASSESDLGGVGETTLNWLTFNVGGPLVPQKLLGYASIFRPSERRRNKATAYGPVKNYSNTRMEYYMKLSYLPTDALLLNASYRTSDRKEKGVSIGPHEADSVSLGGQAEQDIASLDVSWVTPLGATVGWRYSYYELAGTGKPDLLLDISPSLDEKLDTNNLDQMGRLQVPSPIAGMERFNQAIEPIIRKYGYVNEFGNRTGGGAVGAHPTINIQSFSRREMDITVEHEVTLGSTIHELHFGVRASEAHEKLLRLSNGWGHITVPAGVDLLADGTPIFYVATVQQMSLRQQDGSAVGPINSYTQSISLELNDNIQANDVEFSIGVLVSQDTLFGQGLRTVEDAYSGFELAPGEKYRMYTISWKDMVQPRLGVRWKPAEQATTLFANFARYNPEVNSLARAASWDRNSRATLRVFFDESGRIIGHEPLPGSSGKVFQEGLEPRQINEWTLGARRDFARELSLSAHLRWREGSRFWEDTWNLSRTYDNAPAHIAEKGAYVRDLDAIRAEIGGSSYVIAELDDAYTSYREAAIEAEWNLERSHISVSYLWSEYTGNFDQDNTSGNNDANLFIGSSNLADGYGRQLWDNKDGVLRGDRPHVLKIFGYMDLPWKATIGMFSVVQSGQPWEAWDALAYGLPSYFSSTIRFAEKAGNRRSPSHWQLDLSYVHRFERARAWNAHLRVEIFNLFDRQTGYNIDPYANSSTFGKARSRFQPRQVRLSVSFKRTRI